MIELIPHSRPWITVDDRRKVTSTLDSGMIARGDMVKEFESAVARYIGSRFAVATSSGTIALVLALKSIGVCSGQEVILPTYVCKSVLDAVRVVGAAPIFCDVGQDWTVTEETIAPLVNKRTSAIIAVHIFGLPVDIDALRKFEIPIVEDACQAFGVTLNGKKLGTFADVGIFSFHATKCLTTGEGGMVVSSNPDILSSYALSYACSMSDLSAALGLSQLARYNDFLNARKEIANEYNLFFSNAGFPGVILPPKRDFYFRYVLRTTRDPNELIASFEKLGIAVRRGVDILLHRTLGLSDDRFPNAVKLYKSTISIPFYPSLAAKHRKRILEACHAIFNGSDNEY